MDQVHSMQNQTLVDVVARRLVARSVSDKDAVDPDDLGEFAHYLAGLLWNALSEPVQSASYETRSALQSADEIELDTLSPEYGDTLLAYGLAVDADSAEVFARRALEDYLAEATAPPPVWRATRTDECELCERQVPLTYHHLVPRSTHAKALKKGWHPESTLNSVAWLCRPCHNAVHHVASNEDLARSLYTVELILEREDIQRWVKYASKQRWAPKPYKKK